MTAATNSAPRIRSRRHAGFTLIEILVALAVIAVALSALVTESSQHVSNATRMRDRTLAHWVAMNRIAEEQISDQWPAPGESEGTTLMADHEWFWRETISATDDADVRRIDVEVRAARDDKNPAATAIAYLGQPS